MIKNLCPSFFVFVLFFLGDVPAVITFFFFWENELQLITLLLLFIEF